MSSVMSGYCKPQCLPNFGVGKIGSDLDEIAEVLEYGFVSPKVILPEAHRDYPQSLACLLDEPSESRVDGSVPFRYTLERKVMILATLVFQNADQNLIEAYPEKSEAISMDQSERYGFYERLQGFDKIALPKDVSPEGKCFDFVFRTEPWWSESVATQAFLPGPNVTAESVSKFLKSKGYTPIQEPQVGAIALYSCNRFIEHYGRVVKVEGEDVTLQSKFGSLDAYEHLVELVPHTYGSEVNYLIKT